MTAANAMRAGWCPSAYRPMLSGDGLIVRVKPRAGLISTAHLAVIADASIRFGNGLIDLTRRANFQIRGVSDAGIPAILDHLRGSQLIGDDAAAEQVRNIIVDPLHDACRQIGISLEDLLLSETAAHELPSKFGFVITAGDDDPPADIHVQICGAETALVRLDGDTTLAAEVALASASKAAFAAALAFLELRDDGREILRMRDAVKLVGSRTILARAGLSTRVVDTRPNTAGAGVKLGLHGHSGFALAPAFGSAGAMELKSFAQCLESLNVAEIKLSHRRAMFIKLEKPHQAQDLMTWVKSNTWMVDDDDPRARIDVCTGAPGCVRASADTRRDAAVIAQTLLRTHPGIASVHVSGCPKGCARSAPAEFTLVANNARYDVIRNGTVSGVPGVSGIPPSRIVAQLMELAGGAHG